MFTVASAGLADKFSPNMTQRSAAVQNRPLPTLLAPARESKVDEYLLKTLPFDKLFMFYANLKGSI